MKVTTNKNDSRKRKKDLEETVSESPKKAKVHAQRKFAQGAFSGPSLTLIKDKVRPPASVTPPELVLSAKRPNTEDFLTFLCFRRTSILPPKLDFFKDAFQHEANTSNCALKTQSTSNKSSPESSTKSNAKKSDKNETNKKTQTPVQALRRKYQEQRLAKQNPINVRKLAQKVKGKNMVRTRSSTMKEETIKPRKELPKLKNSKETLSGLRSGLQRTPPKAQQYVKKKKQIAVMKNLRSKMKAKVLSKKSKPVPSPEKKTVRSSVRDVQSKKSEVAKNLKSTETSSAKVKETRTNVKKIEGLSDFSSDDNEPLLAMRKGKVLVKGKKLANGIKEISKPNSVKGKPTISEVTQVPVRPTRKTKEAAAIYMEMITKKLVSPEKSGDEDRSSVDSFPELPNAKRNEQRESEIKARAMAMKKNAAKESVAVNSDGRSHRNSALGKRKDIAKDVVSGKNEQAKKVAKENTTKKIVREQSPRKMKEDAVKKIEKDRKSTRDDKRGSKEELTKKILRDRKRAPEMDVPKKNTVEGKEETSKRNETSRRSQEENIKSSTKEDAVKKRQEDNARKNVKDDVTKKGHDDNMKKFTKDDVARKSQVDNVKHNKDESIKKVQEDNVKKVGKEDSAKKNTKDDALRKGQEKSAKESAMRKTQEENTKKNTKEDAVRKGEDESTNKISKEDVRKNQEENTKKNVKEDAVRKIQEENAKKNAKEDVLRKGQEESSKKNAKEDVLRKSQEDNTRKNSKEDVLKKGQEENTKKTVKEDAVRKIQEENTKKNVKEDVVRKGQEESAKKNAKEDVLRKIQEDNSRKNSKEDILKKGQEENAKKNAKEDTIRKCQDESANKISKDDVPKKGSEENIRKILNEELVRKGRDENTKKNDKEEPLRKNKEDNMKKITKEMPKIVKDVELKKESVTIEGTKKPAKEDIKKLTQEDTKIPYDASPKTWLFDKKQSKEEESKQQDPTVNKETKEESVKNVFVKVSRVSEETIKKYHTREEAQKKQESLKVSSSKKDEAKKTVDDASSSGMVNDKVRNCTQESQMIREQASKVIKQEETVAFKPVEPRQNTLTRSNLNNCTEKVDNKEEGRADVSAKKSAKVSSKEADGEKVERKSMDENDTKSSARSRKHEEPEAKQKKGIEKTSGMKRPNSVPKKGHGTGSAAPSQNWLPSPGTESNLVEAPTFYPTEREFQDPLEFFEKIRPAAESFGLCRIVPPSTFKPDCKVSDDMRFTAYNQYVHRMFHRWGPNIKEMMAIKKYLATQSISLKQPPWIGGIEVDLPRLYQSVQNCGGLMKVMEKKKWHQVADMMKIPKAAQDRVTKLDDIYCKYLLPYDTLSHDERQKLFDEVESDWLKRQENFSEEDSEEESYIDECEECVVKGRNMALNQFYRIARNTMSMWFKSQEPSPSEVENEFWRHVSERNNHVCVHSGSIDSSGWGYGFPVAKNNTFSKHPWNLKVLTNNSGSVLRSLGPVMGVTVPTLHVGMVFTAFCWYRDPHGLPWVEYLHTGAPKIWYGISDDNSTVFKEALTKLLPRYIKNKKIWLPSDTAMVPPALLVEQGVSLCHTIQKPGQFILVFPRAYTSSICTGYLVSESVYFAQPSWLTTAEQVFRDIQECCEPTMFSLEKLLFNIATDTRCSIEVLKQVLPMVWHIKQNEIDGRKTLFNLGLKTSERLPVKDQAGNKKKKGRWAQDDEGDYECEVCRANLCVSLVINSQEEGVMCLPHAIELLTQKRHYLKYCKLMYSYTQEELCEIVEKLEQRIESKTQKKVQGKPASTSK